MAKTNSQIQADYKARHLKDENGTLERLDVLVEQSAKLTLKRLAAHYRVTQKEMLEKILEEKKSALLETLTGEQQNVFYDITG